MLCSGTWLQLWPEQELIDEEIQMKEGCSEIILLYGLFKG